MPFIDPELGYLTVINLFKTDTTDHQVQLVKEMKAIVDTAAFPGWISSTVHRGQDKLGTANFIQWQSREHLEARYGEDVFKHRTMPVFLQIATFARLLQTEVVSSQRHPSLGAATEIGPSRDDYTVIEILDVAPQNQDALVTAVSGSHDWLLETPGYRSQSVLRGMRARGPKGGDGGELKALGGDDSFVVVYSQWDSKEAYDKYRFTSDDAQSAARRKSQTKLDALVISRDWNTYRVVHTRSAKEPAVV